MSTVPVKFVYGSEESEERFGLPASVAGPELDRIRKRDGRIQASVVVEEARPDEAPLHPAFEWRDEVAAEEWRRHQATELVREVRVVVEHRPAKERERDGGGVTRVRQEGPSPDAVVDWDPLTPDVEETIGALVEAKRKLESLRDRAIRRFDSQRRIQASVALADCEQAEELLCDAHEAMTAARRVSTWEQRLDKPSAAVAA